LKFQPTTNPHPQRGLVSARAGFFFWPHIVAVFPFSTLFSTSFNSVDAIQPIPATHGLTERAPSRRTGPHALSTCRLARPPFSCGFPSVLDSCVDGSFPYCSLEVSHRQHRSLAPWLDSCGESSACLTFFAVSVNSSSRPILAP
jgi:hypothetical protein